MAHWICDRGSCRAFIRSGSDQVHAFEHEWGKGRDAWYDFDLSQCEGRAGPMKTFDER